MCGIIAIVSTQPVAARLVESLRRLEYRGYDSAGIAVARGSEVDVRKAKGKIRNLEAALAADPADGPLGIGHTRWATHGPPSEKNAHPHTAGRVTLVHNGIIENFAELKAGLVAAGRTFHSDTDTEVVAALVDAELERGRSPLDAFRATLARLHGAYALAVIVRGAEELVLGARRGSPLVVGYGDGEMFLGSDALAVGPFTSKIAYLEEGDHVAVTRHGAQVFDAAGDPVDRHARDVPAAHGVIDKGEYRHFMEKEIHEQPEACHRTLSAYVDPSAMTALAPDGFDFAGVERVQIVACGTAFYAGLTAKYVFERLAGLPVDVEIASEFRYREPAMSPSTLAVAVSQSGETADTLAALKWCKAQGLRTAALVNAHQSSMAREADLMWPTHAGAEIGVASTKAFTAQVCALTALAIAAAEARGRIDAVERERLVRVLLEAPRLIAEAMAVEEDARAMAHEVSWARDVLYLGRGPAYPLAMEGALKLKEISYIHAEGYAAGELKHGPIALVDEQTPVIVLAPSDALFEKTVSNMQEVAARGGPLVMITDRTGATRAEGLGEIKFLLAPICDPLIAPLVYAPAVQFLAYHVGVHKGLDVDQPRNLAKSVTVE